MPTVFEEKVYSACRRIPEGRVSTYGMIAKAVGCGSAQAVGNALAKNPYAFSARVRAGGSRCRRQRPLVPCHRVVKSDGSLGGFRGKTRGKAVAEKARLLEKEGVAVRKGRVSDLTEKIFKILR